MENSEIKVCKHCVMNTTDTTMLKMFFVKMGVPYQSIMYGLQDLNINFACHMLRV